MITWKDFKIENRPFDVWPDGSKNTPVLFLQNGEGANKVEFSLGMLLLSFVTVHNENVNISLSNYFVSN